MELRKRMHDPIAKTGAWLKQMLKGHLNYYAVSGNSPSLWWYFQRGAMALAQVDQTTQPACIQERYGCCRSVRGAWDHPRHTLSSRRPHRRVPSRRQEGGSMMVRVRAGKSLIGQR